MTPELEALARRAVACPRWRWMPGILAIEWPAPGMGLTRRPMRVDDGWPDVGVYLPDLADPATLGCLTALVREAWGDPRLVAIYCEAANPGQSEGWAVQCADNRLPVVGEDHATEAEALVAALEVGP